MLARPWPILILALLHLLSPLFNAIFSSAVTESSFAYFISWQWQNHSLPRFLSLYFLYPLAGLFIYTCKRWSYYAFYVAMITGVVLNYYEWKETPFLYDPLYVMSYFMINTLVMGYFLVPSVRKVYFSDRLRWWETDSRYLVEIRGFLSMYNDNQAVVVRNISLGGAQIESEGDINEGSLVELSFEHQDVQLQLKAEVILRRGTNYSLTFEHDKESYKALRGFIYKNLSENAGNRDETAPILESFLIWLHQLLKTGEGLFPTTAVVAAQSSTRKKLKKKTVSKVKEKRKTTKKL